LLVFRGLIGGTVRRLICATLLIVVVAIVRGGGSIAVELRVGDPAPPFALPGSDGRTYRLSDYQGKQAVVLAWFAKAFTSGWTAECKSLRESGDAIREFNVAHFAISVDTPETNKAFAQSLGVDYPLLSDPTKQVATAYGVVDEDQPFASRWTFYIGSDGRILYIDKKVSPAAHGKNVAAKLAELGVPKRRTQ
jgi:thioredoxin-dependent peroxiredoxin